MELEELYELAEEEGIGIHSFALPDIPSLSIEDAAGDCHIAIDFRSIHSRIAERVCVAHEVSHCKTGAFYAPNAPAVERGRMEYRSNKLAVTYLVPWDLYVAAIMDGCFTEYEQADYWDIPMDYVETVHTVYERTRWDDVQRLKRRALKKWGN